MRATSQTRNEREGELRVTLTFDRAELNLEYSLIGVVVHLADCPTIGEPGGPALPQGVVRVALPPRSKLIDVQANARDIVRLSDDPLPIAPQQPLRPGILPPHGEEGDAPPYGRADEAAQRGYKSKQTDPRDEKRSVQPYPTPPYVPPDPALYAAATRRPTARLAESTAEGLTPVATIHLNPVRLTPEGYLEFSPVIDLALRYESAEEERQSSAAVVSRAQAMRQIALTRRTVINPDWVFDYSNLYPLLPLNTDYLIITDNQRWNAETMTPAGAIAGDLVASFQRLASWKRQRGLKARVVTITAILNNRYGDFRTGSRDLQEVIRGFLKMAQAQWGAAWVLLGGDTAIVPIRRAASDVDGRVTRQGTNPPPENTAFWTGSHLRIHATNLGTWWGPAVTNLLVRVDNGLLIPYDAAGTSNATTRGWFFTTDATYSTRTTMPTNFVRVNGPASEIDADLQFLYEWNSIPTDLYYSSLVGPGYNQPGRHDWDLTDNGVYGQHGSGNLDGINFTPSISLGRAPVSTAAQADAFVDKVIAYEKFARPDGTPLDEKWTGRVVLVSENWGGRFWVGSTTANPPGDDRYHHPVSASHTIIKLNAAPDWNWSLLAWINEGDVRLLPYRTDAAAAGRGWYFARSSTNLSPNRVIVRLPSGRLILQPAPSPWVAVYGSAEELSPSGYIFNQTGIDSSLADQEELRRQMVRDMSGFRAHRRLYEDIQDMTPEQISAGPVEMLTTDALRAALNEGPHIVSLSGHGSSWGCCKLGHDMADSLINGYHTFIAYADSCLTNQVDGNAVSEHLISNPRGGAVAYIGNTRFSWIGIGDDYQRRFFQEWATLGGNAHLGLLNDSRAGLYGNDYSYYRWAKLALNLAGDPEMPVRWRAPFKFRIPQVFPFDKLKLWVEPNPPDPPFRIDVPYIKNWGLTYVHLRQDHHEELFLADAQGRLDAPLAGFRSGPATLAITRAGYQPIVQQINVRKSDRKRSGRKWLGIAALSLLGAVTLVWAAGELKRLEERK